MLLAPQKKAVLFKLKTPERITNIIPSARVLKTKANTYVAVPHRVEETKVLNNLGFKVPSPIKHYYDWPSRYTPFKAQRTAAEFLTKYDRAYNLSAIGTGKSLAALWAYDFLRSVGYRNKVLVVAPLSTLERTWGDEIFQHFPHLTYAVLHGTRAKRLKLLKQDVDVYIVNHDGVGIIKDALAKRPDIDLVVVDELAQVGRNSSTDRWKNLNTIINRQMKRGCWGMTGTPTPNSPTDAWAQCRLITPETVPPYFNRFRLQVMRQISQFKWVPKEGATEVVLQAMQPAVRFTRDECTDLPPIMFENRTVGVTQEQEKAYKDMVTKLHAELADGQVIAVNEAVKLSKLVQIACGVVYDSKGSSLEIPAGPRLQELKDIVSEAEGKVIVYVPFVAVIDKVAEELRQYLAATDSQAGMGKYVASPVEVIHGGVNKNERDRIFKAFQKDDSVRVLVAQPAAMSHGLTLTAASTIVWYSCIVSNDIFEQANGRINRPGQKMNNFVIMLEGTSIERRIYSRLKSKQKLQGALLDEIKAIRGAFIT